MIAPNKAANTILFVLYLLFIILPFYCVIYSAKLKSSFSFSTSFLSIFHFKLGNNGHFPDLLPLYSSLKQGGSLSRFVILQILIVLTCLSFSHNPFYRFNYLKCIWQSVTYISIFYFRILQVLASF